jgi:hypothetical protein
MPNTERTNALPSLMRGDPPGAAVQQSKEAVAQILPRETIETTFADSALERDTPVVIAAPCGPRYRTTGRFWINLITADRLGRSYVDNGRLMPTE